MLINEMIITVAYYQENYHLIISVCWHYYFWLCVGSVTAITHIIMIITIPTAMSLTITILLLILLLL